MPKKTKTTKKDKSVKQTVKQSVVVHVNTDGKSKSKSGSRKKPANVRSFTKGASYMGGTPLRALNYPSNNIVVNVPQSQPQPIFMSDIVNRVSALENVRRSQMADEQQAKSIITPLATQTPTANKPIADLLPTPRLLEDDFATPATQKPIASVEDFDKKKEEHVNDIKSIMKMSANFQDDETDTPTGLSPIMEEFSTPYKTPAGKFITDSPMTGQFTPYNNPAYKQTPPTDVVPSGFLSPLEKKDTPQRKGELSFKSERELQEDYEDHLHMFKEVNKGKMPRGRPPKRKEGFVGQIVAFERGRAKR